MRWRNFALLLTGIAATEAAAAPAPIMPLSGMVLYHSQKMHFAIAYPPHWTINPEFTNETLGPGKAIHGVSFTVSPKRTQGTNLASDTRLSVETLPGACDAARFVSNPHGETTKVSGTRTYSVAGDMDAGAGNRMEETVYALTGTSPCLAVRYFIHYSAIGNYAPGSVKAFDRATLMKTFGRMRRSLALMK